MDASRAVRSEDPASRWHLSGSDGPERWPQALLGVEDASASKTETSAFVGSCASKRGFTEHVSKSGWMSGDSAVESQERLRGLGARTGGEPAFSNKPMGGGPTEKSLRGQALESGSAGHAPRGWARRARPPEEQWVQRPGAGPRPAGVES